MPGFSRSKSAGVDQLGLRVSVLAAILVLVSTLLIALYLFYLSIKH